jgi:hypothetical protein
MMKWNWIASGSIVVMLAYFVVDNHVDLYPWNNLTTSQLPSTLAALIPFGVYATAFALGVRWLMLVGTVHSYVWLALQIRQWWIPYLFGPTALHRDFGWYFANGYDRTTRFSRRSTIARSPMPSTSCCRQSPSSWRWRPRSPCSVVRSEP